MFKFAIFAAQLAAIAGVTVHGAKTSAEPLRVTITPAPVISTPVPLDAAEHYCMTEAIYFEAGNQKAQGMFAVANVILNRVKSPDFPDTICEVVHQGPLDGTPIEKDRCQFSYYCDGKSDVFPKNDEPAEIAAAEFADIVAEVAMRGTVEDNTNGSTYYHATYVDPFWNDVYEQVASVEEHLFYVHYPR